MIIKPKYKKELLKIDKGKFKKFASINNLRKEVEMRIKLRKIKLSDAEGLKEAINSKEVIERLENAPYPYKLKDAKEYIKKSLKKKDNYEFVILLNKKIVGSIVLENPNKGKKAYEIGYFVSKDYWGKGIATKAIKEIIKFGFNKLKIKRIWAGVLENNKASIKVLEKTGFKREGRLRKNTFKKGKYYDDFIYGLIR